jgi:hypothetical protein
MILCFPERAPQIGLAFSRAAARVRPARRNHDRYVPAGVRDDDGTVLATALEPIGADIVLGQRATDAIHVVVRHQATSGRFRRNSGISGISPGFTASQTFLT